MNSGQPLPPENEPFCLNSGQLFEWIQANSPLTPQKIQVNPSV